MGAETFPFFFTRRFLWSASKDVNQGQLVCVAVVIEPAVPLARKIEPSGRMALRLLPSQNTLEMGLPSEVV